MDPWEQDMMKKIHNAFVYAVFNEEVYLLSLCYSLVSVSLP